MFIGSPVSALNWVSRLSVALGLTSLYLIGPGRLSIDGLVESRSAPGTA